MNKLELTLDNNINNNLNEKIINAQKNFIESDLGKVINSAIDIGLKSVLPDLIENQVIDIKNAILEQGFEQGLKEAINTGIDYGKSTIGIFTGKFDNISQVQLAVKNGGIIDNVSKLLDLSINFAKSKKLISPEIASLIKKGKNSILSSTSSKIEETIINQVKSMEKLEKYCENWNRAYENKDFLEMEKNYKNIKNNLNKVIPFENVINESKRIENLHKLIKNNGEDFNITENEYNLAAKLG